MEVGSAVIQRVCCIAAMHGAQRSTSKPLVSGGSVNNRWRKEMSSDNGG